MPTVLRQASGFGFDFSVAFSGCDMSGVPVLSEGHGRIGPWTP